MGEKKYQLELTEQEIHFLLVAVASQPGIVLPSRMTGKLLQALEQGEKEDHHEEAHD